MAFRIVVVDVDLVGGFVIESVFDMIWRSIWYYLMCKMWHWFKCNLYSDKILIDMRLNLTAH